jgi:hypothetical protein
MLVFRQRPAARVGKMCANTTGENTTRCEQRLPTTTGLAVGRSFTGVALFLVCLVGGLPATAQRVIEVRAGGAAALLGAEEGRAIVDVALEQVTPLQEAWDCSHVVHAIYSNAGHAYPYASSSDIYSGNESFVRVRHPRAGDVIAWWGHVGIVVDPREHRFYSLVRTGLQAQNYESAYWRSRGQPRFFRLRVSGTASTGEARKQTASTRPILSEDK